MYKRNKHFRTGLAILASAALLLLGACKDSPGSSTVSTETESSLVVEMASDSESAPMTESWEDLFTESSESESETETETETEEREETVKGVIAIDAGHQGSWIDMSGQEPYAPGSSTTKAKATSGTRGAFSGINEYELNMDIALMLETELSARGYKIVMLREDNDTAISNAERAQKANESGADCTLRLHADGVDDSSVSGATALIPSSSNPYVGHLYQDSREMAECILEYYCQATGLNNRGLSLRDDLTGTNWSEIPVVLLEMGFMSNESDDLNMANHNFRESMVQGIADGLEAYFDTHPTSSTEKIVGRDSATRDNDVDDILAELEDDSSEGSPGTVSAVISKIESDYISPARNSGERWAVSIIDLFNGERADIGGDNSMLSASVLKCFIMAAAYDTVLEPSSPEYTIEMGTNAKEELRGLIDTMITASDNGAANGIVERLGSGSFEDGMRVVNSFCEREGYTSTKMGRRFLGGNENGDNYTSANDCAELLRSIYNGSCVSREASAEMKSMLGRQQRRNKIPAGLPSGVTVANKTGELSGNTGIAENDMAIVYGEGNDYVLCVLSYNLKSGNTAAAEKIAAISKAVYQEIGE